MAVHARREFLARGLQAGAALAGAALLPPAARAATGFDRALPGALFPDLVRHFVFEYYPWYGGPPDYVHWRYLGRHPPLDIASRYYPKLGPYDVRDPAVLEQHASWIKQAGVGAVALSWWGRGGFIDDAVPLILDVLAAHDLKATFALEPYAPDRAHRYADDVLYLLTEYGDKRHWDVFLLPQDADGHTGPVFKSFATILPKTSTDCLGVTRATPFYAPDAVWRQQTDTLRQTLRADFDHLTLLADSLEFVRTPACGFDGIGIYDNFIGPERYRGYAEAATSAGLVFSFNANPGYYQIEPRETSDPCYAPRPFVPETPGLDLTTAAGREQAAELSRARIQASWQASLEAQLDPTLESRRRGFLLLYLNSFNEWHEGHDFEPMKDAAELTAAERALGYCNPEQGDYRLTTLAALQKWLLEVPDAERRHPRRHSG